MQRRYYLIIVLLLLAVWIFISVLREQNRVSLKVGSEVPIFTLEDEGGQKVSLESLRGKVVLINFWATWCGPCRHEMPSLEALYQRYRDKGFVVLGLSVDDEGWKVIRPFLEKIPVTFPIILDSDATVSDRYGIYKVPESYLVDPEGRLAAKFIGPQDFSHEVFSQKIEQLLPESGVVTN